ncbi:MAG: hypothetical protein CMM87_02975 [Rickettsiales bacterium]|nr:hypothetical protein [Rickettsiales bacterium]
MPSVGDTKTVFGRTYVYSNPNQALGPGTWLLSDGEGSLSGEQQTEHKVYGQAVVDSSSIAIHKGMLVYINEAGNAVAASAASLESSRVVGVAIDPANVGQIVQFTQNTAFEFFNAISITDEASSTLDVGQPYYLSSDNPGKWTKNPTRDDASIEVLQCGTAVNEYYMAIDIQPLALKAEVESAARIAGDAALSARIDVLEADPTTATAVANSIAAVNASIASETTARTDADALLMPKTGGTFSGAISGPEPVADSDLATKKFVIDEIAAIPAVDFNLDYGEYA